MWQGDDKLYLHAKVMHPICQVRSHQIPGISSRVVHILCLPSLAVSMQRAGIVGGQSQHMLRTPPSIALRGGIRTAMTVPRVTPAVKHSLDEPLGDGLNPSQVDDDPCI
jgi:hypothetical protein